MSYTTLYTVSDKKEQTNFRLKSSCIRKLKHASKITGKTMTRLLEEAIDEASALRLGKEKLPLGQGR